MTDQRRVSFIPCPLLLRHPLPRHTDHQEMHRPDGDTWWRVQTSETEAQPLLHCPLVVVFLLAPFVLLWTPLDALFN